MEVPILDVYFSLPLRGSSLPPANHPYVITCGTGKKNYRMGGNFRGVLIFVDFMVPTSTTKIFSKNHCTSTKITFWEDLKPRIYLCSTSSLALFCGTRGGTIPTTVRVSCGRLLECLLSPVISHLIDP